MPPTALIPDTQYFDPVVNASADEDNGVRRMGNSRAPSISSTGRSTSGLSRITPQVLPCGSVDSICRVPPRKRCHLTIMPT